MTENIDGDSLSDWTYERVHELMEHGVQPLKTDIQEIKETMVEVMKQLVEIRRDLSQLPVHRLEVKRPNSQEMSWPAQQDQGHEGAAEFIRRQNGEHEMLAKNCDVSSSKDQSQQAELDLRSELVWFKKKVELLQEEFHLQKARQEEILSTVKAHCAFTEGVIREASKTSHDSKESAVEMSLEENAREAMSKELIETKDNILQQAVAANKKLLEGAVEKLQALTIGQSQRVVDKIRNPSSDNRSLFHFFIPQFEDFIGFNGNAYSSQYAIDFMHTFLIVRGMARFSAEDAYMTVGLEHTMGALELGLDKGIVSPVAIKARIKAPKDSGKPDIKLDGMTVPDGGDSSQIDDKRIITLGRPVECCKHLVEAGYNTHKDMSLLIEFEITDKPEQYTLFSLLRRKVAYPWSIENR
ncbi:hypothetical protein RRG08_013834 [Elysia crispata]|uniref:Uncharacterized protein n=1 Tax=Elysia crispata TaxID=231223 RepID=A0AAE1D659_9GAST|nr:hypothetical protein RRG08_013834 [Elysia crispata]